MDELNQHDKLLHARTSASRSRQQTSGVGTAAQHFRSSVQYNKVLVRIPTTGAGSVVLVVASGRHPWVASRTTARSPSARGPFPGAVSASPTTPHLLRCGQHEPQHACVTATYVTLLRTGRRAQLEYEGRSSKKPTRFGEQNLATPTASAGETGRSGISASSSV